MIKASNVIVSIVPIKLTDVRTSLTDIAPIIETFFPRLFGFCPRALEPFKDLAYQGKSISIRLETRDEKNLKCCQEKPN